MGKTKTVVIDDSQPKEVKPKPKKKVDDLVAKINAELGVKEQTEKRAKSESVKAVGTVEPTTDSNVSDKEAGAKQTDSEPSGRASGALRPDERASSKKPAKSKPRGKKYQEVAKELDKSKAYPLTEAVDMVKKMSYAKFNGSLDAHIVTAQTGIRGFISLPYASGKKLRILAFGKGAETSGADFVGSDETIETISKGKIDFDILITTPEWMAKLARVAKNLGPKGLMPNPKSGTIVDSSTDGLKKAVESFQAGKTEYATESKAPLIHLKLGQLNQPTEELAANIKTLYTAIGKSRIKKISLSPTMGPAVKVELSSI